jgi:hydroxymethylbilane synthase
LALAQTQLVLGQCRAAFPDRQFEIKIIKTTGDKLQTASLANLALPKGLFTKELEQALIDSEADVAVHSLKDLPTELPEGLVVGAVTERADVRDVLVYRGAPGAGFMPQTRIADLPPATVVATSSTRRRAQVLENRPDLQTVPIRGNVPTRLRKLAEQPDIGATILAAAGLFRLGFVIEPDGRLHGEHVPAGLLATILELDEMLPCIGQGAIGLEIRADDEEARNICAKLNHEPTFQSVTAERAFLSGMGGGCQLAVAAFASVVEDRLRMRAVSFLGPVAKRGELEGPLHNPVPLGEQLAASLLARE